MREREFERLYAEHARPLFSFLVYRTGDYALAEDLLADTFERVLRARRPFDPRRAAEKTWLYTIALNLLRDHSRKQATGQRVLEQVAARDPRAAPDPALAAVGERDTLERALECLSAEEREAIALRFGSDLTVPEIAKLKSEKLTTVEGRVYRALRKLRDELGGEG